MKHAARFKRLARPRCFARAEDDARTVRGRSRPAYRRTSAGFTLIELMIAITLLAVVAVLAWRGLDQIVKGREIVTDVMTNERVVAQTFDQIGADSRAAAQDDDVGGGEMAVRVGSGELQLVRYLQLPQQAPRLQVVRYRIEARQLVRLASPPLATLGDVRQALRARGETPNGWTRVTLIRGVAAFDVSGWTDEKGWTANNADLRDAADQAAQALSDPGNVGAPMFRAIRGIRVNMTFDMAMQAASGKAQPYVRTYLVGE